ncbi:hypothetical protein O0I10_012114 [Lichtheimia ornata]|uniref:Uncharacterized protein n=1 Tax=Lichtheimia ornata TaxID=688661 RepID=A0AAD7USB3_9FUNG|nr:uncharacterized protein O0I10_012114 [Lichtheimia ornata]KAJ8652258.1 hypothetical protein O0I10_012114 [Lichtheimia ornata]
MLGLPWGYELGPVPNELLMVIDTANMAARFHTYKQHALKAACQGKGLKIDTQIHEVAALSHIDIEAWSIQRRHDRHICGGSILNLTSTHHVFKLRRGGLDIA